MPRTLISVDPAAPEPLYRQVRRALEHGIASGLFGSDAPLPSSRQLAHELGLARNTINTAYQELIAEGFVESRPRRGLFVIGGMKPATVANDPSEAARYPWAERLRGHPDDALPHIDKAVDWHRLPYPFIAGQVDAADFPSLAWMRALREALRPEHVHYSLRDGVSADDPLMLEMLCRHVLPGRGIEARPDEVLLTMGSQQGLHLLGQALLGPDTTVVVEDPGYLDARHIFLRTGARLRPAPVDAGGLVPPDDLGDADLVYLTPSHHHPTNVTLGVGRRHRILDRIRERRTILIEDDYDSEFRYRGRPSPALKAMDETDQVVYLGTFSKFLAPGLRMGYLVAAPELHRRAPRATPVRATPPAGPPPARHGPVHPAWRVPPHHPAAASSAAEEMGDHRPGGEHPFPLADPGPTGRGQPLGHRPAGPGLRAAAPRRPGAGDPHRTRRHLLRRRLPAPQPSAARLHRHSARGHRPRHPRPGPPATPSDGLIRPVTCRAGAGPMGGLVMPVDGNALGSRYVLERRLGEGAMGMVWQGRDRESGAVHAIKLLRTDLVGDAGLVGRFVRERTALLAVRHPHTVAVHDMVVEGDRLALVMDFVPGEDLRAYRLRRGGALPPAEAAWLLAQICEALAATHAAGIVHRDLKPANVLLDGTRPHAPVRLADFGIARFLDESPATSTGAILGTPGYLAPEVLTGERPGPACDTYAVGITLYELITGSAPFTGTPAAVFHQHVNTPPRPDPRIPHELWNIVARCLDKRPDGRPSAAELAASLAGLMGPPGSHRYTAPDPPYPERGPGTGPRRISPPGRPAAGVRSSSGYRWRRCWPPSVSRPRSCRPGIRGTRRRPRTARPRAPRVRPRPPRAGRPAGGAVPSRPWAVRRTPSGRASRPTAPTSTSRASSAGSPRTSTRRSSLSSRTVTSRTPPGTPHPDAMRASARSR